MNILQCMSDPSVFGLHFHDRENWKAWRTFLSALFGLPMQPSDRALFQKCTGRQASPRKPCSEAWLVCGRRSGKSFTLALIAVYLACFKDWRPYLTVGERATIVVIAADRKQSRVIMRYVKGLLQAVPMLARTIEGERAEAIDLKRRVSIEVHTASFRTTRGYTIVAALCDELAFWSTDDGAANPDQEILAALRPSMATIPNAMLLCASSPYARKGELYRAFRRHYGPDGDPSVLVWKAPTRVMNPTVPQRIIDEAMERDPASASAEYYAEFRSDVESFIAREAVEACIATNIREHSPVSGVRYSAFVDPSGGASDSMTLAIAHKRDRVAILDSVREMRPPFSPEEAVREFSELLRRYGISTVQGDRYAGEWPREQFRRHGIKYEASAKPKSDLYVGLLPRLNSREVELLDHPRLIAQLCALERRTSRGGRDSIDHPPGGHDDICNAAAGVVCNVMDRPSRQIVSGAVLIGASMDGSLVSSRSNPTQPTVSPAVSRFASMSFAERMARSDPKNRKTFAAWDRARRAGRPY